MSDPNTAPAPDDVETSEAEATASEPARERRLFGVLSLVDRPLATGFLVTVGVLIALVIGSAVVSISTILVYIVLGVFLAVALDPIVRSLERRKVKRGAGIAIVFSGFALLVVAFCVFVLPPLLAQIVQFVEAVPEAIAAIPDGPWYATLTPDAQVAVLNVLEQLAAWISAPSTLAMLGGGVLVVAFAVIGGISAGFIVVALTLYFLASMQATKNALYALSPAHSRPRVENLTERITASVGASLIGSVTLSGLNAAAVFGLHLVIGLAFPALMAVVAFIITLVPLFGSVIFLVIGTLVALFTGPTQALIFLICYLVYIQIESYVLSPRIMNKAVAIPPALVLIGAMVGGTLAGIVGVLVALPTVASILLIIREVVIPKQDRKI